MSLHDAYARMTPFEIAFPDSTVLDDLARAVMEEATARRVDPELPGVFITLGSVDDFVRDVLSPEDPEGALLRYGGLIFHAVHFVRADRPLYLADTSVARRLVDDVPGADPQPPASAGYLQLPQHLFWMAGTEKGAPESLDGLFWFASEKGVIHVLPITSVLPDGPGFGAVPLPEAPLGDAPAWLDADMREGADDYASTLPGHDIDGLYSVETAGEILKLLARFFAYLGSTPAAHETALGPDGSAPREASSEGPRPSALPYTRVTSVA
jgi:hypothetical protein